LHLPTPHSILLSNERNIYSFHWKEGWNAVLANATIVTSETNWHVLMGLYLVYGKLRT